MSFSDWYLENLACPRDLGELRPGKGGLMCVQGHLYPLVQGVPVMLIEESSPTLHVIEGSLAASKQQLAPPDEEMFLGTLGMDDDQRESVLKRLRAGHNQIDPVVDYLVSHTNGIMYKHLVGKLRSYPIPKIDLPRGDGKLLLDVGCSWGRWSIAAARLGYNAVGIDPSLGAVLAARRVAQKLGVEAKFIVADARFLPFRSALFDIVYSYSVLQHFSVSDMKSAITEMQRVTIAGGELKVQMANALGVRSFYHQLRRGFATPAGFQVRYLRPKQLQKLFQTNGDHVELRPDCYFGLGLQKSDAEIMTPLKRTVLFFSETLKRVAAVFSPLQLVADSVFVSQRRRS
jgi:ubiquinone/menaquinone biosynthesis C-methylase UbiE/uncharacterized protein YbaR (Trm112 family)